MKLKKWMSGAVAVAIAGALFLSTVGATKANAEENAGGDEQTYVVEENTIGDEQAYVVEENTGGDVQIYAVEENAGVNVQAHTIDEIRDFIKKSGASVADSVDYSENPVLQAPYGAGRLAESTQQSALKMLNQVRYIAGIDANVTLDESYIERVQAGALVNAVNNQLSHTPEKPVDMSDDLYQLGYSGTSSANLGWNYGTLNSAILNGWMYDGDSSNISRMGHRRWLLNPRMGKTGFGKVGAYSAVYALDNSNPSNYTNVAWPARTMPLEYFGTDYPWTLSTGTVEDGNKVAVTLVRKSDNRQWSFSADSADGDFYVDNDGYGQNGCVIFRPMSVGEYSANDVFEVTITGLAQGTVNYEVNFFALDESKETQSTGTVESNTITNSESNTGEQTENDVSLQAENNAASKTGEVPKTGDNTMVWLYVMLAISSVCIFWGAKRKIVKNF